MLAVHVRQVGPGPVVEAHGEKLSMVVSFDVAKAGGLESAFERVLEDIVLDLLKSSKTPVKSSREHFNANASFEYICQIVQAARNLYKLKGASIGR